MVTPQARQTVSFRTVLQVREFRWVWLAGLQSLLGDQLARVALSVLVFDRTHSGALTATVYALTFLPALLGTPLGVLADRLPRRSLLVGGDLIRAVLLAAMALPGMPLGALICLLVAVVLVGCPWKAAESALVADMLAGEGYALGTSLRLATGQGAQLIGFAVGGVAVAAIGARSALAVNALTFALSALVLRIALSYRPAVQGREVAASERDDWRAGFRVVLHDPRLRLMVGYAWLAGAFVAPEGLAAPYAQELGGGAQAVGLLLAAAPTGALIGALLFVRLVPVGTRMRVTPLLAVGCGLPLIACAAHPGLTVSLVLWGLSGLGMTYQVQVMTEFVTAAPVRLRGQAIAFASSGLLAAQGVGLILAGLVAKLSSTTIAVATAGLFGSACALVLAVSSARRRGPVEPDTRTVGDVAEAGIGRR